MDIATLAAAGQAVVTTATAAFKAAGEVTTVGAAVEFAKGEAVRQAVGAVRTFVANMPARSTKKRPARKPRVRYVLPKRSRARGSDVAVQMRRVVRGKASTAQLIEEAMW